MHYMFSGCSDELKIKIAEFYPNIREEAFTNYEKSPEEEEIVLD